MRVPEGLQGDKEETNETQRTAIVCVYLRERKSEWDVLMVSSEESGKKDCLSRGKEKSMG